MRIEVKKRDVFTKGSGDTLITYGHQIRARIIKNKVGTAGKQGFVDLYYDAGFDLKRILLRSEKRLMLYRSPVVGELMFLLG